VNLDVIRGEPAAKRLKRTSKAKLYDLPLVSIRDEKEKIHVLCRVGDNPWNLSPFFYTSNTRENRTKPDLSKTFPKHWQRSVRALLCAYFAYGLPGKKEPAGTTLVSRINNLNLFVTFLEKRGIRRFQDVKPLIAMEYVEQQKKRKLKPGTLTNRFIAVEMAYLLRDRAEDALPQHPWPESSATFLAGDAGGRGPTYAKTEIIPDDIAVSIFQAAEGVLNRAHELLAFRDGLEKIKANSDGTATYRKNKYLETRGLPPLGEFNRMLRDIRDASFIVLGLLTGCRNHELADITTNAVYFSEQEGEILWWLRSSSWKTHEGPNVEWMCPAYCAEVAGILERYSEPFRRDVNREIAALRKILRAMDDDSPEYVQRLAELSQLQRLQRNRLFLALSKRTGKVRVLSDTTWSEVLTSFCSRHGINWKLKPHQLRRTFAVFAARNIFSDMRYLRHHLKHWGWDMTTLYAHNEKQDRELYDMILEELHWYKRDLVYHWWSEEARLDGGAGKEIMKLRGKNKVRVKDDRLKLLEKTAENVSIRGTGHSWCLGEKCRCDGHGLYDFLDCPDCRGSVIDDSWLPVWKGLYLQQLELKKASDIGDVGQDKVLSALNIIRSVLRKLGVDPRELERQVV
jgi:integrase